MEMEKKTEIHLRLIMLGCWGMYLDPGGMKLQCTGGYCTLRRLMICTAWKMLFRWSYKEEQCLLSCGMDEVGAYSGFWWGTNHLKVLGCYERIKLNGSARNASSCCRMILLWMETYVTLLWKPQWITGMHEMCRIAWLIDILFVSHEKLYFLKLVIILSKLANGFTCLTCIGGG